MHQPTVSNRAGNGPHNILKRMLKQYRTLMQRESNTETRMKFLLMKINLITHYLVQFHEAVNTNDVNCVKNIYIKSVTRIKNEIPKFVEQHNSFLEEYEKLNPTVPLLPLLSSTLQGGASLVLQPWDQIVYMENKFKQLNGRTYAQEPLNYLKSLPRRKEDGHLCEPDHFGEVELEGDVSLCEILNEWGVDENKENLDPRDKITMIEKQNTSERKREESFLKPMEVTRLSEQFRSFLEEEVCFDESFIRLFKETVM
jgi:hypothetical protein